MRLQTSATLRWRSEAAPNIGRPCLVSPVSRTPSRPFHLPSIEAPPPQVVMLLSLSVCSDGCKASSGIFAGSNGDKRADRCGSIGNRLRAG